MGGGRWQFTHARVEELQFACYRPLHLAHIVVNTPPSYISGCCLLQCSKGLPDFRSEASAASDRLKWGGTHLAIVT